MHAAINLQGIFGCAPGMVQCNRTSKADALNVLPVVQWLMLPMHSYLTSTKLARQASMCIRHANGLTHWHASPGLSTWCHACCAMCWVMHASRTTALVSTFCALLQHLLCKVGTQGYLHPVLPALFSKRCVMSTRVWQCRPKAETRGCAGGAAIVTATGTWAPLRNGTPTPSHGQWGICAPHGQPAPAPGAARSFTAPSTWLWPAAATRSAAHSNPCQCHQRFPACMLWSYAGITPTSVGGKMPGRKIPCIEADVCADLLSSAHSFYKRARTAAICACIQLAHWAPSSSPNAPCKRHCMTHCGLSVLRDQPLTWPS